MHAEPGIVPTDFGVLRPQDNQQCAGQHGLDDVGSGKEAGPLSARQVRMKKRDHRHHVREIVRDPAARAVLVVWRGYRLLNCHSSGILASLPVSWQGRMDYLSDYVHRKSAVHGWPRSSVQPGRNSVYSRRGQILAHAERKCKNFLPPREIFPFRGVLLRVKRLD